MDESQFYFQVQDDSMNADRIYKGDVVVFNSELPYCKDDIVLVAFDSQTMIRRVDKKGDKYILSPSNPNFDEIICDNITILGVIVKVLVFY